MFDHRLGLALGKSLGEVKQLSYVEYRSWQMFYALEPFGFLNQEYALASILSILYNANRGKHRAKDIKSFMRDMLKGTLEDLLKKTNIAQMSKNEIIAQVKKDFGIK